jgi:hypothetical protein
MENETLWSTGGEGNTNAGRPSLYITEAPGLREGQALHVYTASFAPTADRSRPTADHRGSQQATGKRVAHNAAGLTTLGPDGRGTLRGLAGLVACEDAKAKLGRYSGAGIGREGEDVSEG